MLLRVDLGPDVIGKVEDIARLKSESAAAQHKAVGPLATPAAPRLQQPAGIVIPREAIGMATRLAIVALYAA